MLARTDSSRTELAARLRLAITRSARRLRQEADAGLSPSLTAALATIERHGPLTPSRLAELERVQRPTATRLVAKLEQDGLVERTAAPGRRPLAPDRGDAGGQPAAGPGAQPQERLPGTPVRSPQRRGAADAGRSGGDPRAHAGRRTPLSAGLRRALDSLAVPNYRRYFAGQVISLSGNWMQIVAEMWLVLHLTDSGVAVGVTSALQFLPVLLFGAWGGLLADRLPKRGLLMVTQAAMALPALTLFALAASGSARTVDGLRARVRARGGQRDRQPDASELRDRDGRARAGRQRGQPQQRDRAQRAHRRPGARRHRDRALGRRRPASCSTH